MTPPTPEQVKAEELREALAALCHEQWSGWMEYLFNNCEDIQGMTTLPAWADERWRRQMMTPYAKLSEAEKESDRHEADRILGIMRTWRDYTRATEQRSAAVEKVVVMTQILPYLLIMQRTTAS